MVSLCFIKSTSKAETMCCKYVKLKTHVLLLFTFLSIANIKGQDLKYQIFVSDTYRGDLTVTKSAYLNGGSIVDVDASFRVEALGESTIDMYSTSFYKRNILTDSETIVERNGRVRERCRVKLQRSQYKISRRHQKEMVSDSQIDFTLSLMYLLEPVDKTEVFSERYGEMCEIIKQGTDMYLVKLPIGNSILYYYQNGICIKTESKGNLQNTIMKLVNK